MISDLQLGGTSSGKVNKSCLWAPSPLEIGVLWIWFFWQSDNVEWVKINQPASDLSQIYWEILSELTQEAWISHQVVKCCNTESLIKFKWHLSCSSKYWLLSGQVQIELSWNWPSLMTRKLDIEFLIISGNWENVEREKSEWLDQDQSLSQTCDFFSNGRVLKLKSVGKGYFYLSFSDI